VILHHEVRGAGPAVLLVHAGIADSRMWEPLAARLADAGHSTVVCDLRGFGRTPLEAGVVSNAADLVAVLDELEIDRAAVAGASFGGRVALELALQAPERVAALVLLDAALDAFDWSPELEALDEAEEALIDAGDVDGAVALNVRFWVQRPGERDPGDVDPAVCDLVADMQRAAFVAQIGVEAEFEVNDPPMAQRLAEIDAPALVVVGADDVVDFQQLAARLAGELPGAGPVVTIPGAAHLPALERPSEVAAAMVPFLATHHARR
jgi:3-oxoadipate enol-lactonase